MTCSAQALTHLVFKDGRDVGGVDKPSNHSRSIPTTCENPLPIFTVVTRHTFKKLCRFSVLINAVILNLGFCGECEKYYVKRCIRMDVRRRFRDSLAASTENTKGLQYQMQEQLASCRQPAARKNITSLILQTC
jgi:hypothetical protein